MRFVRLLYGQSLFELTGIGIFQRRGGASNKEEEVSRRCDCRRLITRLFAKRTSAAEDGLAPAGVRPVAAPDSTLRKVDELLTLPCFQPAPWLGASALGNAFESGIGELKQARHGAFIPRDFADHVLESLDYLASGNDIAPIRDEDRAGWSNCSTPCASLRERRKRARRNPHSRLA